MRSRFRAHKLGINDAISIGFHFFQAFSETELGNKYPLENKEILYRHWPDQKVLLGFSKTSYKKPKWTFWPIQYVIIAVVLYISHASLRLQFELNFFACRYVCLCQWYWNNFFMPYLTLNSLKVIGEGNGNPLQYSCLENPRDRGAWWAAIYGVTESQTEAT